MATKSDAAPNSGQTLLNPLNSSRGTSDKHSGVPRVRLRRFFKRFGPFISVLIFVVSLVFLLQWLNDDGPQPKKNKTRVSPLQIENLQSFVVRKNGEKSWEISAGKVEVSANAGETIARNVSKATLFQNGKTFLTLKAPLARLSNVSNNLEASGGVSASGPNQFSFQTAIVRWINKEKLVQIPESVRATLRKFEFDAPNLQYFWESGELICDQPVELRAKGVVLRSRSLKANVKSRKIEMGGGVEFIFDPKTANLQEQLTP